MNSARLTINNTGRIYYEDRHFSLFLEEWELKHTDNCNIRHTRYLSFSLKYTWVLLPNQINLTTNSFHQQIPSILSMQTTNYQMIFWAIIGTKMETLTDSGGTKSPKNHFKYVVITYLYIFVTMRLNLWDSQQGKRCGNKELTVLALSRQWNRAAGPLGTVNANQLQQNESEIKRKGKCKRCVQRQPENTEQANNSWKVACSDTN